MEFRQLTYFLTLCEQLHFTRAAEQLGISQPTLSQQIKVLEDEFGVPLFDRMGKKTMLTEAGKILYEHGRVISQSVKNVHAEIADLTNEHTGHLRVAVLPSDLDYRLPSLLASFYEKFPHVSLEIISSVRIVERVLANQADIGVALANYEDDRLIINHFYEEDYSLFVPIDHPLALVQTVTPQQLEGLEMMLYPKGYVGRNLLDQWAYEQEISFEILLETGTVTSLFELVRKGIGVTIQPTRLGDYFTKEVVAIPIYPSPTRTLAIYYRKDKYLSRAAQEFIEIVLQDFN